MNDYYEQHYSTYDHPQYDHHHQGQAYSGHTLSYTGDPTDENVGRRSGALGSHHSHTQSHGSVSASTRSWVQSTQMNPPLPPTETGSAAGQTPFHGSRPLPDPQSYHYQQQQNHQIIRRPLQYDYGIEEEDEDDEHYLENTHGPLSGIPEMDPYAGYQHEPMQPMRYIIAGPSSVTSGPSTPGLGHQVPRRNRSFVGGFFNGLKRIPKMFRSGDKHQIQRRPTFGTEGSSTTATGFTPGNTLPRYLSNPSIGPSNPQFAHRLSQAVANGTIPPDVTPSAFQIRPPLVSPQQPVLMVTPPSEGAAGEEQQAEYFEGSPMDEEEHYQLPPQPMPIPQPQHPMERTTYMAYSRESEAPTVTQSHPTVSVVNPAPAPPPPPPQVQVVPTAPAPAPGPRVSYPAELPTRATIQAQSETVPLPTQTAGPSTGTPMTSPPRRRFTGNSLFSSRRTTGPRGVLSPATTTATSVYTGTTRTSYYDPSFSSELGPVERFFKHFYHLPWISQGRVTVDYRPGDSPRAKGKLKSVKKPKPSWYHAVMSRSRRNSLDLLSSPVSEQDSNILSSLGSPISRRSGRSSSTNNHRHKSSRSKHHRSKRRRTATSGSTGADSRTNRSTSPMVPNMYPYNVPPYLPYTYPYAPYPPMAMPPPSAMPVPSPSSSRMPRGPRAARSHRRRTGESSGSGGGTHGGAKYPHGGYAPFQPLAMPPPPQPPPGFQPAPGMPGMYFMSPSPPHSHNGGEASGTAGQQRAHHSAGPPPPMGFSPVLVHYVPTYGRQGNPPRTPSDPTSAMVSPPTTPQRHTAASAHHS